MISKRYQKERYRAESFGLFPEVFKEVEMAEIQNIAEKKIKPANGITILIFLIFAFSAAIAGFVIASSPAIKKFTEALLITGSSIVSIVVPVCFGGLKIIKPNEALVLSLFGKYYGTIYEPGFYFVNPFCSSIRPANTDTKKRTLSASDSDSETYVVTETISRKISTKLTTFVNGNQKVNDKLGNPVEVSAIVVWRVTDATKAVMNVDNYKNYLSSQTDSTIRNVARLYPYDLMSDNDDDTDDETTLRGSAVQVAEEMKKELARRVADAGIEIVEVRLNQIAYATEIAAAMLQKQQAVAIIAARKKIVEGAVSMVEMALERLKENNVVDLDEERKAQMVSNLLVVLCGNKEANPVLNTGSIY